ncbi:Mu transposase C-terminal domain-containing protein [Pseudomonas viridiflava]|uniref:Mu transposase C-terminal domain-containing protein n=1 Tax=Pseudomonas viridiflava TaxID=33069 RepID=UPI0013C32BB1|nr:Mu transposase C-terminal domain-containing protein [Pseudomonas viridiflava]
MFDGRRCAYEASIDEANVLLYDEENQEFIQVGIGQLEPFTDCGDSPDAFKPPVDLASEDEWKVAAERYEIISEYMGSEKSSADLNQLQARLGVSQSRCYALIAMYDPDDGPEGMLRARAGRKVGSKYLPEKIETIISSAFKTEWSGPGANQAAVIKRVSEICEALDVAPPANQTIINRIKERSERELMILKEGMKRANDRFQPRPKKNKALRPLELTEMDHCLVDCIIVDDLTRKPLCRPWVTILIDIYSRVALGVYFSVHAPSRYSVSMAVTNATFPKDSWLETLAKDDLKYPYYGKPELVLMDNAKEFRSKSSRIAAKKHNMKWKFRPKGKPWWGGHIERLFGTLQVGAVQFLPGATLRNVVVRGDYDSEKHACLTFSEFREWLVRGLQIYHNTVHSVLKKTPHEQWVEGWKDEEGRKTHPRLLDNPLEFSIDFFPEHIRTVTRQGIEIFNLQYWSGVLTPYIGKRVVVKYNPLSLRHIWINPNGERYFKISYQDITQPDVSLEELTLAKRQRSQERGARAKNTRAERQEYFRLISKNRERVEDAKSATKAAHKMRENLANAAFTEQVVLGRAPALVEPDDDDEYEQPFTPLRIDVEDD